EVILGDGRETHRVHRVVQGETEGITGTGLTGGFTANGQRFPESREESTDIVGREESTVGCFHATGATACGDATQQAESRGVARCRQTDTDVGDPRAAESVGNATRST